MVQVRRNVRPYLMPTNRRLELHIAYSHRVIEVFSPLTVGGIPEATELLMDAPVVRPNLEPQPMQHLSW